MKPSIRHLCTGLLAGGAILLAAVPASAGNVNWAVSVGVPAPVVYAPPPPAYYPAPVVYGAPAYYPAPAPVVAPVVYVSGGGYRHHYAHPRYYHGRHGGYPYGYHHRGHY